MEADKELRLAIERFGRLSQEFRDESDRGCAVLVMCLLEEALRDYLLAFVVDPEMSIGRLMPKGGLGAGIESALLLGLLNKRQAKSFQTLANVRNKFAHGVFERLTFETPEIRSLILSCEPPVPLPEGYDWASQLNDQSLKTRFLMLCSFIWIMLVLGQRFVERRTPPRDSTDFGVSIPVAGL